MLASAILLEPNWLVVPQEATDSELFSEVAVFGNVVVQPGVLAGSRTSPRSCSAAGVFPEDRVLRVLPTSRSAKGAANQQRTSFSCSRRCSLNGPQAGDFHPSAGSATRLLLMCGVSADRPASSVERG